MFSFPEFLLSYSTSTPALFACLNFPSKTKLLMFVFLTNLINIGVILYFITSMDNPFFPRSIYLPADFTSFLQFLPRQALGCPRPGWSTRESVPAMAWDMVGFKMPSTQTILGFPEQLCGHLGQVAPGCHSARSWGTNPAAAAARNLLLNSSY